MAWQIAINSLLYPIHNLKPPGFPPERSLNVLMNFTISSGVSKAEWYGGDDTLVCGRICLIRAISTEFFSAGRIFPCHGLVFLSPNWYVVSTIVLILTTLG